MERSLLPIFIFLLFFAIVLKSADAQLNPQCQGAGNAAAWYCNGINTSLVQYWQNWAPIAMLAVLVSFGIASLIFGIGTLLRSERLRTFGIGEYYEALASALIVGLFLFISAVMFGLIPGIVTGPVNPYNLALSYMTTTISSVQKEELYLFHIAALDGFYINTSLTICTYPPVIACPPVGPLFQYAIYFGFYVPAFVLIDLQLEGLQLLFAEFWIVLFFMYMAIPVFLVPGVVLRSILPTRSLGGWMIAAAIGFYMVLPILFSVAYYFTHQTLLSQISADTSSLERYGYGTGAETNAIYPTSPLVQTLNSIENSMNTYWLAILFYPSLIMALTYAIIVQIADFIGGMAQLSSKLRV